MMPRLPQSWLLPLDIARDDGAYRAALCIAGTDWSGLWEARGEFLHPDEERQLLQAGVPKRQADFLRGRYCAKEALGMLLPARGAKALEVASGVFGQPVVRGQGGANLQVSIAHSDCWAAAIAFDEAHPMAIDLEAHDGDHGDTLRREASAAELAAFALVGLAESHSVTLIWAAKESLAKVLRTGLMAPLLFYEVGSVERAAGGGLICAFRHFAQYKSYCGILGRLAVAITLPRKSVLQLDWRAIPVEPR